MWNDYDFSGTIESDEDGIPSITVRLTRVNADGTQTVLGTTVTNASGDYLFPSLGDGNYYVEALVSDRYIPTTPNPSIPVTISGGSSARIDIGLYDIGGS